MMKSILFGILTCSILYPALGSNILAFMPSPYTSHITAFMPLFKELAQRGHNVTFFTARPYDHNVPNLKQIVIDYGFEEYFESAAKNINKLNGWQHILFLQDMGLFVSERLLQHPEIQKLIQSTELTFDVLLTETLFTHESFIALGHKYNAPIVHIHPIRNDVWLSHILRNPQPLSYVPNYRMPATNRLTFYQRFYNLFLSLTEIVRGHLYYLPEQERLMRKYFKYQGSDLLPPLLDQLQNTSLVLLDVNQIVSSAAPLLPNFILVGGIHITNKTLPADLEAWINESSHGVIYLSLGSIAKVSSMEPRILNIFLNVLGKLPQRILWKWEKDGNIPGQPSNVKTSKWFPQMDILAHPKCRAFITHGGFHSVLEAAYFGVPIVGTPLFSDQEGNLFMVQQHGYGEMVKFSEFSEELLSLALNKVLLDPSFQSNAKRLSILLRDVPVKPLEKAVYWVEHVIKYKGVQHLTVAGVYLPWYKYYMVDVIGTVVLIIIFILTILYKLFKLAFRILYNKIVMKGRTTVNVNKLNKSKKE